MVGDIFCDFPNYNILLSKLKCYGVNGTTYKLIKSYLQDRFQRVVTDSRVLDDTTSSE
jgi:hypothetical protein